MTCELNIAQDGRYLSASHKVFDEQVRTHIAKMKVHLINAAKSICDKVDNFIVTPCLSKISSMPLKNFFRNEIIKILSEAERKTVRQLVIFIDQECSC